MISEPVAMNFLDCNTKTDLLAFLDSVLTHLASNKSTNPPLILVTTYLLVLSNQKNSMNHKHFQINLCQALNCIKKKNHIRKLLRHRIEK